MTAVQTINGAVRKLPAYTIYIVGAAWSVWLLYQALTGGLGVDPVKGLEHALGLLALQLLIGGLCITPLRRFTGVNLIKFRRAIGVTTFSYVALHLLTWIVLDMGLLWGQMLADIYKRPYVTIGMAGFLMLLPLAITSNNRSIRKLGPQRWNKLHWLVYPAALAGGVHYMWLVKAWPIEPMLYLGAILALLAVRMVRKRAALAA